MKRFLKDMAERAIKTAGQSGAAALTMYAAVSEIDWQHVLGIVGICVLGSVLTSLASFRFGNQGTASVTKLWEDSDNG